MFNFSRERRLLKPSDYKRVFNTAKRIRNPFLTFYVSPNNVGFSRLGLAIAKKSLPDAVMRNRLKRLSRESFRQQELPNVDVIVTSSKKSNKMSKAKLREQLNALWATLKKTPFNHE